MLVRVDSTLTTTAVILHRDPISLDHRYGNTREEDLARREPAGTCFLLLVFLATLFCIRASARVCKTRRQRRARVVPRSVPEPSLLISRRHTIDRSIDREINVHGGRGEQRYDSKSFDFTVFFFFLESRTTRQVFASIELRSNISNSWVVYLERTGEIPQLGPFLVPRIPESSRKGFSSSRISRFPADSAATAERRDAYISRCVKP